MEITGLRLEAEPVTVMPRPRRNSRSPSSRSNRRARKTVLVLTSSTVARSRAGGSRSPGRCLAVSDGPADLARHLIV